MLHSAQRSSRFLNTLTDSAMTTDSGNLFQCDTTRKNSRSLSHLLMSSCLSLTVEVLQGKMCQNSLPSGGVGQFEPRFQGAGVVPLPVY